MGDRLGDGVEFRILGPVQAVRSGLALPLGGPRQRHLLALLLLTPGRARNVDQLVDELWSGEPPDGADITLRSYVSRLRRVLGDDVPIVSSAAGYLIECAPRSIDAVRFEALVRDAERYADLGAPSARSQTLRDALALWAGPPFAGVPTVGLLQVEADRLNELRLHATEQRIEADLALGAAAELIDELEALVATHPYRERLWQQLMLALYRADRQADALAAYHRARRALADELGIEPGDELRRLEQAILRQDVPRIARPATRHNLPTQLTTFVGRDAEIGDLRRLLFDNRLVTLTGVGGVGKTRLAIEAATRLLPDLPGGAYFVDLAALGEPTLVGHHVAAALDIRPRAGTTVLDEILERLGNAGALVVLDNCEHLRDACAEIARSMVSAAPRVRILATSRTTLGVPGEVDYPVSPLPLPSAASSHEELRDNESVRLLLARARAARPRLGADEPLLATAARICRDLDGLPLAIELAAARARALSLDEIADRLSDRFRFLVSWRRLTPARHQTLQQAMEWSFELLPPADRNVFAGLAVFAGGFTLAAAAATCLEGDTEAATDCLERLVDASLVVPDETAGSTRYSLLETVRQYARSRLDAGAAAAVRMRHAAYFADLARRAEPHLTGADQTKWFETLELEHDNLRAALAALADTGESERLLEMAASLMRFWYVRGHLAEARLWLGRALDARADMPPHLLRRALTAAAAIALLQGFYADAVAFAEDSLAVARETGEQRLVANGLSNLGAIVLASGDADRAASLLIEAVDVARQAGDERILALALNNLGDQALTIGEYDRAAPLFDESLALLRKRDDTANVARSLFNLGCVALGRADLDAAEKRFGESLALSRRAGDKEDLAWGLLGLAGVAVEHGAAQRAATLLGASGALLDAMGAAFKPFERKLSERVEERARAILGEGGYAAARSLGAQMPPTQAVEYAAEPAKRVP